MPRQIAATIDSVFAGVLSFPAAKLLPEDRLILQARVAGVVYYRFCLTELFGDVFAGTIVVFRKLTSQR